MCGPQAHRNSVESRGVTHLESMNFKQRVFIPMVGPRPMGTQNPNTGSIHYERAPCFRRLKQSSAAELCKSDKSFSAINRVINCRTQYRLFGTCPMTSGTGKMN